MRNYSEQQWKEKRKQGRNRFVLMHGFFGRGLPMGLFTAVVIETYLGGTLPDALAEPRFLGRLLLAVAVFTLSGSLAARANWAIHERRHGGN